MILELHNFRIYCQALIKKQDRYWPCNVPGECIDEHFHEKYIGSRESLKQTINGIDFLSIVKRREVVNEVEDHQAFSMIGGKCITFKYPEPHSGHNKGKHWVDDYNNRRHNPIDIADT